MRATIACLIIGACLLSGGCDNADRDIALGIEHAVLDPTEQTLALSHAMMAYHRSQSRWPNSIKELTRLPDDSIKGVQWERFQRMALEVLPNGQLKVSGSIELGGSGEQSTPEGKKPLAKLNLCLDPPRESKGSQ